MSSSTKQSSTVKVEPLETGVNETPKFIHEYKDRINLSSEMTDKLDPSFSHDQLLPALYWVWDVMDRALINFFLVGDTLRSAREKRNLFGDKIMVGVRRTEWESGSRAIADAFAKPLRDEGNVVYYEYNGVPIELHVLEEDESIKSLNHIMYAREYFNLPNPYEKFAEVFSWLK